MKNQFIFAKNLKSSVTSRCSITPALRAYVGQFLIRGFVVLLRKSIPQNHNLKTAAELGVKNGSAKWLRLTNLKILIYSHQ